MVCKAKNEDRRIAEMDRCNAVTVPREEEQSSGFKFGRLISDNAQ